MAEVKIYEPKQLDNLDADRCRWLSLRGDGYMRDMLTYLRKPSTNDADGRVFVVREEGCNPQINGWALAYKDKYMDRKPYDWEAYFYVRNALRKQGIGRSLLQSVNKNCKGVVRINEHDSVSRDFFAATATNKNHLEVEWV